MQMLILDKDITLNSQFYCDKHLIKIPLEIAQMVCTTYHILKYKNLPSFIFAKASYINHPITKWVRENRENFIYACTLGLALYKEYQYRYNRPNKMQRVKNIFKYALNNIPKELKENKEITPFALAMPEKYKCDDTVKSYRDYYIGEKSHLFKWTKRDIPYWVKEEQERMKNLTNKILKEEINEH